MFVALSRFVVANGMEAEVTSAFRSRPHLVDSWPGFVRMEVLTPRDAPAEFWLLTWWRDRESYESWHADHTYKESHAGIPAGLKLVPGQQYVRGFDRVAD